MSFQTNNDIRFYTFSNFSKLHLPHAIFTRNGGVSTGHLSTLNVGGSVGDTLENVQENRKRCFNALDRKIESVFDSWLVHGTDVLFADRPRPDRLNNPPKADIILTNNPEVTLFMRFGDCVPILFHDPIQNVNGIAHGGWQGTIDGVAIRAVEAMQEKYGSNPEDIHVGIGPSICVKHYEIGVDVAEKVKKALYKEKIDKRLILPFYNNRNYLDLKEANKAILNSIGINKIEVSEQCTACNLANWFSHRAEKGKTGRFGVLLALNERR